MRGILIAAGLGTRLGEHTRALPKCLLKVGERSLLEHQIEAFRSCGIRDIVVVTGFCAELFPDLGVRYVHNPRYRSNNILNSLMYAEAFMDQGFLASYSDLVYESQLLQDLLEAPQELVISVDDTWKNRYAHLDFHPPEAVEKVCYDDNLRVQEIGKAITNQAPGEFVGLIRAQPGAAQRFVESFHRARQTFWGRPFIRSSDFEKAYLTDFLQYFVDEGGAVHATLVEDQRWVEIDTEEDLELARQTFA